MDMPKDKLVIVPIPTPKPAPTKEGWGVLTEDRPGILGGIDNVTTKENTNE